MDYIVVVASLLSSGRQVARLPDSTGCAAIARPLGARSSAPLASNSAVGRSTVAGPRIRARLARHRCHESRSVSAGLCGLAVDTCGTRRGSESGGPPSNGAVLSRLASEAGVVGGATRGADCGGYSPHDANPWPLLIRWGGRVEAQVVRAMRPQVSPAEFGVLFAARLRLPLGRSGVGGCGGGGRSGARAAVIRDAGTQCRRP